MVLMHDKSSECPLQIYEVSLKYLGSQVIERTRCCDGQTDRQTDAWGKTICLPTLRGGDINIARPKLKVIGQLVSETAFLNRF